MTKNELIQRIHSKAGSLTKTASEEILNEVITAVAEAISNEGRLSISGLGTFTVRQRKARKGRNPKTNQPLDIPASKTVSFKPAPALKSAL